MGISSWSIQLVDHHCDLDRGNLCFDLVLGLTLSCMWRKPLPSQEPLLPEITKAKKNTMPGETEEAGNKILEEERIGIPGTPLNFIFVNQYQVRRWWGRCKTEWQCSVKIFIYGKLWLFWCFKSEKPTPKGPLFFSLKSILNTHEC